MIELLIQHEEKLFIPIVEDGVAWSTDRHGSPSKLTFNAIDDGVIKLAEGDPVRFKVDNANVFYGFIFSTKRTQDGKINVTAYDQTRYLKNKDTYVYENKTASAVVRMIANDFRLNLGTVEETKYIIPSRIEDNTELADMIQNALDLELAHKNEMFILYDDFGKLTLKNVASMQLDLMIDSTTAESYTFSSSIDTDTYNQIKLVYENKDSGKREVYIAKDSANINKWGVLQLYETIEEGENGKAKADALLKLYNERSRVLTINNCFGDVRCRAGFMVLVTMDLGDVKVANYMLIESAKHTFNNNQHLMNLTLKGGALNG